MSIQGISAITFATHDMARSVAFYEQLGFERIYGGATEPFTSLRAGSGFVNLTACDESVQWRWWGRVIFYVDDVDGLYERARRAGFATEAAPRDAEWGERYFHMSDPDGHELSFACPL